MQILIFLIVVALGLSVVWFWLWFAEYLWCVFVRHQAPCVASSWNLKRATVNAIRQFYPNAKRIIEIGSGHGGLARYVARRVDADVVGVENMPFAALVSKIGDGFCFARSKTMWMDAFDYLDEVHEKFDVAIAYLGPKLTPKLTKYKNKIKVLIAMDFEIPKLKPVKIINLRGSIVYGDKKYPHRLFIYEFK